MDAVVPADKMGAAPDWLDSARFGDDRSVAPPLLKGLGEVEHHACRRSVRHVFEV